LLLCSEDSGSWVGIVEALKVDDCVLSNVFVYLRNNVITEKLIIDRMLCSTTVNYIPENGLEKQVLIPRSYKCNSI